jgi:hypothetical protein
VHTVIGCAEFACGGGFIGAGARAVPLVTLLRQGRQGKGGDGKAKGDALHA